MDGKVTAVISIYDAWSQQISCQEDREEAKAFYKRKGMMDTDGTLRFSLLSKQSLPGTAQEVEITMEPYKDMSRQADKKLEPFHRTAQGTAGKRLNVSVKYKIPDKTFPSYGTRSNGKTAERECEIRYPGQNALFDCHRPAERLLRKK